MSVAAGPQGRSLPDGRGPLNAREHFSHLILGEEAVPCVQRRFLLEEAPRKQGPPGCRNYQSSDPDEHVRTGELS